MKATLMLGILSASFAFITSAHAQHERMSQPERAGYDDGWDAAQQFCQDLRMPEHLARREGRSVSQQYERGCKKGFDEHIDSNRTCKRRLSEQNKYSEMRQVRRFMCD